MISRHYAENADAFDSFELVACADLDAAQAEERSRGDTASASLSVDELIADPAIDVVLNLTPPAAHAAVIRDALAAGKHVYTEKPLATELADAAELVAEAARRGLRIGCAPDTFLGSAVPGRPRAASTRARSASRSRSAPRCSSADRRRGTRTRTSSSRTAPGRCSTWARTT